MTIINVKGIHDFEKQNLVTPPDGYKDDFKGVWVMGVGEPVKVLVGEYTILQYNDHH